MYQPVPQTLDFPGIEQRILRFWDETDAFELLRQKLSSSPKRYSFIDGPITANGMMGVHHAWGRTYKDIFQRYRAMTGHDQRFQNGFDCQGLWVEVEVERELGFGSKRDIEAFGIDRFVQRCKERVLKYARIQAEQSKRLGYWMDWDDSYYTMSDENNYTIWSVIKTCHERGWLYRGHDVMPWCPRCGTGISQHEIDTEGYQEVLHTTLYVKLPLVDRPGESLLVWTTTPWTLSSNVAAAVHPDVSYVCAEREGETVILAEALAGAVLGDGWTVRDTFSGRGLVGLKYRGPYDELDAQRGVEHRVIPWTEVSQEEGTGIVHIAPGCGEDDFKLGKEFDLPAIAPVDDSGVFLDGFGWLTGRSAQDVTDPIADDLRKKGILFRSQAYLHRYPHCWRCQTELLFRLVDEWYIRMDELRPLMMDITRQIRWLPELGLDRELDWLRNMHDWMISKKRYWGLALPIWTCEECGRVDVMGSKEELRERAVAGWNTFEDRSPHRPWVDAVKIACSGCGAELSRIMDVGNPWLDAGIVPYSTLHYKSEPAYWKEWFPADFITESFPGQYRNWFYSMLVMSAVLENVPPFLTVLGFGTLRGEDGRPMHKSWGNAIAFDEAADTAGADVLRWVFSLQSPAANLNFGWKLAEDAKRRLLTLWNCYSFFVTYARIEQWRPDGASPDSDRTLLDRWILARLQQLIREVQEGLDAFDCMGPSRAIEAFVEELSNWYIRRNRPRFWAPGGHAEPAALRTLYEALTTVQRLMAPFMPFLSEEMYQNLVRSVDPAAPMSVHHCAFPEINPALEAAELVEQVDTARLVASLGHAARKGAHIPVRRPLPLLRVAAPDKRLNTLPAALLADLADELNVKRIEVAESLSEAVRTHAEPNPRILGPKYGKDYPAIREALQGGRFTLDADGRVCADGQWTLEATEVSVSLKPALGFAAAADGGVLVVLDTTLTPELVQEGRARDVIRLIQDARKEADFSVDDRITVLYRAEADLSSSVAAEVGHIARETLAVTLERSDDGAGSGGFQRAGEVDGMPITVVLTRVAAV